MFDLLKEFKFSDFKGAFLKLYEDYDGIEYIKEFEKIYSFYRDNAQETVSLDFSKAELDIVIEPSDNHDKIFYKLIVRNNNDEYQLDCLSWFLTPCLKLSDNMLKNYSKEDILAHYLYQIGYEDLLDIE